MKTHYAVPMREYSGFGRSFGRDTDQMTRACSISNRTTAPLTRVLTDVACASCKRTFEFRSAVAKEEA